MKEKKVEKKKMNVDEGLKRLGILIAILLAGIYYLFGLFTIINYSYHNKIYAGELILFILFGVVIFFIIVGIFSLVRWVIRGFQK